MPRELLGARSGLSRNESGEKIQADAAVDFVTKKHIVVRSDHHYIHKGYAFSSEIKDMNLANAETKYIEFTTNGVDYIHFKDLIAFDCKVAVYENPDAVDRTGATELVPINQNRISTRTSGIEVYYDVTPTIGAGKLVQVFQNQTARDTWEMVFKQNTTYLIEVNNTAGAQNNANINGLWYEEPEGIEE